MPTNPTTMYLLTAVVLSVVALVCWVVKFTLGRFADGQDKIVAAIQDLRNDIATLVGAQGAKDERR